jgi:hypothetical protein
MSDRTHKFAEVEHAYCSFVPSFEGSSSHASMMDVGNKVVKLLKAPLSKPDNMQVACRTGWLPRFLIYVKGL